MSHSPGECSRVARRKIRAEAAAWLARLHGPDRTAALEVGLKRWLAEHPLHAREFELATDVWEESGGHVADLPKRRLRSSWSPGLARVVAPLLTATAAALLIGAWLVRTLGPTSVSTGVGEQKSVLLADGSRVTLNTNTRVLVQYGEHSRTVTLKYGEAYFDVVHNAARPFIVRAGERRVIDLGTRFVVSRTGRGADSLTVTVIEGRVAVAPLDLPKLSLVAPEVHIVSAGQLVGFRPDALPTLRTVSVAEATAWLNGQLIFDGTPLGDAAAQFNRYNSIKIRVITPSTAAIPVGGVFRIGDSVSFARAVADSHHLILITGDGELLLEPDPHHSLHGSASLH